MAKESRWRYGPLSKQHENEIATYRAACIARQLSTEPADCERVEHGIASFYRFTGMEAPKSVLWIDSPAPIVAGPIAAGIMWNWANGEFSPNHGDVEEAVEAWVRPYVNESVPEAVIDVVRTALEAARDSLRSGGPSAIDAAAEDANQTTRLRKAFEVAVTSRIVSALQPRVYERLREELEVHRLEPTNPIARASDVPRRDAIVDAEMGGRNVRLVEITRLLQKTRRDVLAGRAGGIAEGQPWFTSFVRDVVGADAVCVSDKTWQRSRAFEDMQGAGNLWPHRSFCIVTHPPVELHAEVVVDEDGRRRLCLHNATGPAVVWRDGTAQWYLNDIYIGCTPPPGTPLRSWLTVDRITTMQFPLTRRRVVQLYGRNRYLRDARAVRIDVEYAPPESEWAPPRDVRYRALWRLEQSDDEPIVVVDVINQSPEPIGTAADGEVYLAIGERVWRRYMLAVPPTVTSCSEAVAWTYGKTAATYAPSYES